MPISPIIRKRAQRFLDAAYTRGAFDVGGSFYHLSAEALADEMAAEWDRHAFRASLVEAADLEDYVALWLRNNADNLAA